jgi:hypothetical protein
MPRNLATAPQNGVPIHLIRPHRSGVDRLGYYEDGYDLRY